MEKVNVITYKEPYSPISEAYHMLATNILAGIKEGEKKRIVITSISGSTNSSVTTANIGVAIAQTGVRTLIMDCNLRNPKQHELFGVVDQGLTDCIAVQKDYKDYIVNTAQNNLFLLPAGTATLNITEISFVPAVQCILEEGVSDYDVILIDTPPVGIVADTVSLATKTAGVLLVLTNKQDKVEQAQKAKEMFTQAGVSILGCVLDKTDVTKDMIHN